MKRQGPPDSNDDKDAHRDKIPRPLDRRENSDTRDSGSERKFVDLPPLRLAAPTTGGVKIPNYSSSDSETSAEPKSDIEDPEFVRAIVKKVIEQAGWAHAGQEAFLGLEERKQATLAALQRDLPATLQKIYPTIENMIGFPSPTQLLRVWLSSCGKLCPKRKALSRRRALKLDGKLNKWNFIGAEVPKMIGELRNLKYLDLGTARHLCDSHEFGFMNETVG
jgi:hypothetical protein